jgi:hypothetical protein
VIGELDAPAAMSRQPIGAVVPRKGPLRDHVQVLELLEEVVVETEGHVRCLLLTPNFQLATPKGPGALD